MEDSTTSYDGRVDCNIETSSVSGCMSKLSVCFQRMQTASADERGGMDLFPAYADMLVQ